MNTIDKILNRINKDIKKLRDTADYFEDEVTFIDNNITALQARQAEYAAESARANRIADKFEELVS